jgi:putative endonuclease
VSIVHRSQAQVSIIHRSQAQVSIVHGSQAQVNFLRHPKSTSTMSQRLRDFVELRWRHSTDVVRSYTVYILKCSDNTHYVGCTSNLDDRLLRHARGEVHYTASRLPVRLKVFTVFDNKYDAYSYEKYLKSGSGRAVMNKRLLCITDMDD